MSFPYGWRHYGSLVFVGTARRFSEEGGTGLVMPLRPMMFANYVFRTEESRLEDVGPSLADLLQVPRQFVVKKCRDPSRLRDYFLGDRSESEVGARVQLTFEDVVLLRLAGQEPPWLTIIEEMNRPK